MELKVTEYSRRLSPRIIGSTRATDCLASNLVVVAEKACKVGFLNEVFQLQTFDLQIAEIANSSDVPILQPSDGSRECRYTAARAHGIAVARD